VGDARGRNDAERPTEGQGAPSDTTPSETTPSGVAPAETTPSGVAPSEASLARAREAPPTQTQDPPPKARRDPPPGAYAPHASERASPPPSAGLAERVAGWLVPERNASGSVYGLITVGALLSAEGGLRESYPDTLGSAAIAVLLYWFAHAYADALGLRLSEHRRLRARDLWHTLGEDWAIARSAGIPLLALLVAWVTGAGQETALGAGVWTVVGGLIAYEVAAGIRARARPGELAFDALVGVTMGVAILVLRALLH
jgi:hypothetical protein